MEHHEASAAEGCREWHSHPSTVLCSVEDHQPLTPEHQRKDPACQVTNSEKGFIVSMRIHFKCMENGERVQVEREEAFAGKGRKDGVGL